MVDEAIEKANHLIEALKWIRQYRGKYSVIKIGGNLLEDEKAVDHLLVDIVFMESVGMKPVLIHGGGSVVSKAMKEAGLEPRFVQGRRYTDAESLKIVVKMLGEVVNSQVVQKINNYGGMAQSLSVCFGSNILFGRKLFLRDENCRPIDLGYVGDVTRVNTEPIEVLCNQGIVPVIPSIAMLDDGGSQPLNINADTAAIAVAKALKSEKLVFVSEVNGVRTNPNDPDSMIESVTAEKAREMLVSGTIQGGMIPKIQACLEMLEQGVQKIHIINGHTRHSLLLEIFTSSGVGTEITKR
ncbi:MAG: acetylglutamate kinase [Planctomycetaceae bacterium]|jgi:acetylglutamate kinase|nr:acetylglutamate kinase [Planctomycetaceae bacterium]